MKNEPNNTFCPVCFAEDVETYFMDINGEIIGCEVCAYQCDAAEYEYERWVAAKEEAAEFDRCDRRDGVFTNQ